MGIHQMLMGAGGVGGGEEEWTTPGTYSWTVPADVTSISAVVIGGGAGGTQYQNGGGGGGLAVTNNMPVTPGSTLTIVVGAGGARKLGNVYRNAATSSQITGMQSGYCQASGAGMGRYMGYGGTSGSSQGGTGSRHYSGANTPQNQISGTSWYQAYSAGGGASGYSANGGTAQGGCGGNGSSEEYTGTGTGGGGVGIYGEGTSGANGVVRGGPWQKGTSMPGGGGGSGGQSAANSVAPVNCTQANCYQYYSPVTGAFGAHGGGTMNLSNQSWYPDGGNYGGGGGSGLFFAYNYWTSPLYASNQGWGPPPTGDGAGGAVAIMWPGDSRSY